MFRGRGPIILNLLKFLELLILKKALRENTNFWMYLIHHRKFPEVLDLQIMKRLEFRK
jgi:hypothetical protein